MTDERNNDVKYEPIDKYFDVALSIVKSAGLIIKEHAFKYQDKYSIKSDNIDLVTEIDKRVEEKIIRELSEKFPDHKFIGEESTADGKKVELTDNPTWIIDPVDGTMNFVHGFPHYCISLGLAMKKECVIGIIYNPVLDQLFTAKKGCGAHLNSTRIKVSNTQCLENALITTETGTSRDQDKCKIVFENFVNLASKSHGIRSLGSCALNIAMVAMGGADASFEMGIHAWDIAAGSIIVKEAGGVCIDPSGGDFDLLSRRMLCAANMPLAQDLASKLVQYHPTRDGHFSD